MDHVLHDLPARPMAETQAQKIADDIPKSFWTVKEERKKIPEPEFLCASLRSSKMGPS